MRKSIHLHLADALDALMAKKGLSNNELGKKAGVAPNTIANYRDRSEQFTSTGKPRSAKLAELERIAAALEVEVVDLLGAQPEALPARPAPALTSLQRDVLNALADLSEEDQLAISRDLMARAEKENKMVQRRLEKMGIKVPGYAADRRVEAAYGAAPVPTPSSSRQLELDVGPPRDDQ